MEEAVSGEVMRGLIMSAGTEHHYLRWVAYFMQYTKPLAISQHGYAQYTAPLVQPAAGLPGPRSASNGVPSMAVPLLR